jgi:hypothetical protein
MIDKIPTNENTAEKIHNEREVLNMFEEIIDGDFEILRNLEDESGLYILEVQSRDEEGDLVQHNYMRAGTYAEGFAAETTIDVVFHMGDMPCGGHAVRKYRDGTWIDIAE